MSSAIEVSDFSNDILKNYIRYTPEFIENLSQTIDTELSHDIVLNLLEIKQNNKFIKKRSPIKLKYTMKTNLAEIWRNEKIDESLSNENKFIEEINGNLNKLSDGNYDLIETKMHNLIINNKNDYKELLIDIFFKKSISEKTFTSLYAKLCLLFIKIYGDSFKMSILEKVKNIYDEKINVNFSNDYDEDNYEIFCERNKEKSKLLGIFTFIGSLYEYNIIEYHFVMKYFNILLKSSLNTDDDPVNLENYIECMITLITNIGKKLESELNEDFDKLIINNLKLISQNKEKYKPRTRFLVMDLLDLRKNKWKK